jgi:Superfamily II helicase and inactivated derivatives
MPFWAPSPDIPELPMSPIDDNDRMPYFQPVPMDDAAQGADQPDPDDILHTSIAGLPDGYVHDADRRFICTVSARGADVPLCGPLHVACDLENVAEDARALLIEFLDRHEHPKEHIIPVDDLMKRPSFAAAALANRGLEIPGSPGKLSALLRAWRPATRGYMTGRCGWFCPPSAPEHMSYVLRNGHVLTQKHPDLPSLHFAGGRIRGLRGAGTLEGWQDGVAAPARGNPLLMFAISAALAGAILELLGLEGGGFNIHGQTGGGKTTALYAATSVSGDPATIMQWHATSAGFEIAALRANDGFLPVDEIPTTRSAFSRELAGVIYMVANGVGKTRSDTDLTDIPPNTWRTILLTTAERPMHWIFANAGIDMPEGLDNRLPDIPAKSWTHGGFADLHHSPDAARFSDAIKATSTRNFGHAGPLFVQKLIQLRRSDRQMGTLRAFHSSMVAILEHSLRDHDLNSSMKRVIRRLAAVSTAGQLAAKWRIVPWTAQEMRDATVEIAQLWRADRAHTDDEKGDPTLDRLRRFLARHLDTDFADLAAGQRFLPDQHFGWHDCEVIAISSAIFAARIAGPHLLSRDAARRLAQQGILIPGGEARSLQQRRPLTLDPQRRRDYWFSRLALAETLTDAE